MFAKNFRDFIAQCIFQIKFECNRNSVMFQACNNHQGYIQDVAIKLIMNLFVKNHIFLMLNLSLLLQNNVHTFQTLSLPFISKKYYKIVKFYENCQIATQLSIEIANTEWYLQVSKYECYTLKHLFVAPQAQSQNLGLYRRLFFLLGCSFPCNHVMQQTVFCQSLYIYWCQIKFQCYTGTDKNAKWSQYQSFLSPFQDIEALQYIYIFTTIPGSLDLSPMRIVDNFQDGDSILKHIGINQKCSRYPSF